MSEEKSVEKFILNIGFDPTVHFASEFQGVKQVQIPYDLDKMMDLPESELPQVILCGQPPADMTAAEIAQLLRMKFPSTSIYLIVNADQKFNRKDIIKNGFNDLFFIPVDILTAREAFRLGLQDKNKTVFKSVKLIDMQAGQPLDFDTFIFLPMNQKYIKFSKSNSDFEPEKLDKLKSYNVSSLYIDQAEAKKFYAYTAKVLKSIGQNSAMSQTEKDEKLKSSVRDVVTGLFSDTNVGTDSGKKVVEDCQAIVRSFVVDSKVGKIYDRILVQRNDNSDSYAHYTNVSTFAAMFAIGIGLDGVEEIALAGLLHDLGLSKIPFELQKKPEEAMTPEEKAIYEKHVEYSIAIMQDRKLVLPDLVFKIVLQHHERFHGQGYPKKMPGHRILPQAQVLAFADLFDYMTSLVPGRPQLSPVAAAKEFRALLAQPDKCPIDPSLLKKILALFPGSE